MKVYKLFRLGVDGLIYPLYIDAKNNVEMGVKIKAIMPPMTPSGRVKSNSLGELCYRPGWHCCEIPLADHIGKKVNGKLVQRKEHVWCEVEIEDQNDYSGLLALKYKTPRDRMLKVLPKDGYYWYKTNPNAKVNWLISESIKVVRMLSNEEVDSICLSHGIMPQEREI